MPARTPPTGSVCLQLVPHRALGLDAYHCVPLVPHAVQVGHRGRHKGKGNGGGAIKKKTPSDPNRPRGRPPVRIPFPLPQLCPATARRALTISPPGPALAQTGKTWDAKKKKYV